MTARINPDPSESATELRPWPRPAIGAVGRVIPSRSRLGMTELEWRPTPVAADGALRRTCLRCRAPRCVNHRMFCHEWAQRLRYELPHVDVHAFLWLRINSAPPGGTERWPQLAWRGGRVAVRVPLPQQPEPGISMGKYLVILFGRRSRHRRSTPHTQGFSEEPL